MRLFRFEMLLQVLQRGFRVLVHRGRLLRRSARRHGIPRIDIAARPLGASRHWRLRTALGWRGWRRRLLFELRHLVLQLNDTRGGGLGGAVGLFAFDTERCVGAFQLLDPRTQFVLAELGGPPARLARQAAALRGQAAILEADRAVLLKRKGRLRIALEE